MSGASEKKRLVPAEGHALPSGCKGLERWSYGKRFKKKNAVGKTMRLARLVSHCPNPRPCDVFTPSICILYNPHANNAAC
jgi:hypothetical protein